jgi:tetratricopeptide (TPR) repeat protein
MIGARHLATVVVSALLGVLRPESSVAAAPEPLAMEDMVVTCGPPPPGHRIKGKRDYRQRNANIENQRDFVAHEWAHIWPARARVNSGRNLDFEVMNNLDFVLTKVPNNEQALRILIEWDLMGGRDHEGRYKAPACYLIWGAQFAPDDPVVWNYGGYYFNRKGDTRRAMQWWQQALVVDPTNAEVHNTLGLIAFENGDYAEARKHAWAAYAAGYPLPTLRDKLTAAGQWRDAPAETGPNEQ